MVCVILGAFVIMTLTFSVFVNKFLIANSKSWNKRQLLLLIDNTIWISTIWIIIRNGLNRDWIWVDERWHYKKRWGKKDCIEKLIQVMIKKVNKNIWRFYKLAVLQFGAKNVIYYAAIIYLLVAGENIVLILDVKTSFSQIKQKKKKYVKESLELYFIMVYIVWVIV